MKNAFKNYLFLFGVAGLVIALDQWTKVLLRSRLAVGETWSPWSWLAPYIQIVNTQNTGAAFSLGRGLGPVFGVLACVAVVALIYFYGRLFQSGLLLRIALALLLGGISGNLIDRLTQGTVTDFIAIRFFAIINVADISITIGTAMLILSFWLEERRLKKQGASSTDATVEK